MATTWMDESVARMTGSIREFNRYFITDWTDLAALHFEVDPDILQPMVPVPLHIRANRAYVSIFVFRMENTRLCGTGPIGAMLMKPVASQPSMNVRTYVIHRGEPGVFFLKEWMPSAFGAWVNRMLVGLPYRPGSMSFNNSHVDGRLDGAIRDSATGKSFSYSGRRNPADQFRQAEPESLDHFLMERYTNFMDYRGMILTLRVAHRPWEIVPVEASVQNSSLLELSGPWYPHSRMIRAHYSRGIRNIQLDRPRVASRPSGG